MIDAGEEQNLAVSHGVFLSHDGKLWAFHGAYHNKMENIHTRAYTLDEDSGKWIKHGIVIRNGFWPMNQPVKMQDGNWMMPGMSAGPYFFRKVFVIRRSRNEGQPGESAENLSLAYPYAVEHDGHLYVGYSNNGGRRGNLNSAELAIIPIQSLQQTP